MTRRARRAALFTRRFWGDAVERLIRAGAAAMLSTLTGRAVGLLEVHWLGVLEVGGMAALVSLLTSIVAAHTGDPETAGFATGDA
jgi:hypothetical protein